jgi:hypothetical protein
MHGIVDVFFSLFIFQEVIGIIQLLDPEGKGKVSFTDFCQGVQQILEVQGRPFFSLSTEIMVYHVKFWINTTSKERPHRESHICSIC